MRQVTDIQQEVTQVGTIESLASVFEAIASIHIAQIKDKVMSSTAFFDELWQIYTQLRVDAKMKRPKTATKQRAALVAVTSEGGLIGDIDERIINSMLAHPGIEQSDLYVIGAHGAALLNRKGIKPLQVFPLPKEQTEDFKSGPIVTALNPYSQATVYYQTYVSLLHQEVARIDLFSAIEALQENAKTKPGEVISSRDYIFEPSIEDVIAYMEGVMREIAIGQVVLESKLAQYASRFNAMSSAKLKADEMRIDLRLEFNRSRRSQSDERTKETLSAMKAIQNSLG